MGMCCRTFDGGNIGIIKAMAITSFITPGEKSDYLLKILYYHNVIILNNIHPTQVFDQTKIIVNGNWIGIHNNPDKLYNLLRLYKQNNIINIYTSIAWYIQEQEIIINTDD